MNVSRIHAICLALITLITAIGCGPKELTIQELAEAGDLAGVKARIERGDDIDERRLIGWTALHHAALAGHLEVVRTLIDAGANVNYRTVDTYRTPLHHAALNGHTEIVQLLLDAGAKTGERDKEERTARDLAEDNHSDIVRLLDAAKTEEAEEEPTNES